MDQITELSTEYPKIMAFLIFIAVAVVYFKIKSIDPLVIYYNKKSDKLAKVI